MLGKLIKYDLKSMSRVFIPMWALSPVIGILLSISARGVIAVSDSNGSVINTFQATSNGIVSTIMGLLFFAMMVGLFVMSLMFVIQRFWNGLLKEEGYLMFTLPVEPWKLIVSKALSATLVTCVSTVVGVLSCALLAAASLEDVLDAMSVGFRFFYMGLVEEFGPFGLSVLMVLFLILSILSVVEGIYEIYAAMSLGQLAQNHRVLGACVWFIGMNMVLSLVGNILGAIVRTVVPKNLWYYINSEGVYYGIGNVCLLIVMTIVEILLFHFITERVLSTRLNLE